MTLSLTNKDREMLRGDHGPATKMAMSILVRMAEISGAKELKHNILTEIKCFKGKQIINVKTNIDNRFLKAI